MKKSENLLTGNLTKNIFLFTSPIILSSVLQLLFNAADLIVVGRFDTLNASAAQAAIGTTGVITQLTINMFIGISIGVNVVIARLYAERSTEKLKLAVQNAMFLGIISGIIVSIIGYMYSGEMLKIMNVNEDILPLATAYLKIIFLGAPFNMIYNFGSAIMRASGDTKNPMIYLIIAGVFNVMLNLITVIYFKMGVAGVGIATSVSNLLSCVLIVIKLFKTKSSIKLTLKDFRFSGKAINKMLIIGIPAGIQSSLFSLSNVVIQSSVNSFGPNAMAGCGDATNLDGFIYAAINAYSVAAVTFVGQCCGADQKQKINKVLLSILFLVTVTGLVLGFGCYIFGEKLLGIYTTNPADIAAGMERMRIIATTYFLCGIMDSLVGAVRAMGQAIIPMIITLVCVCVFRVIWIAVMLDKFRSLTTVFISYPISWSLSILFVVICYIFQKKKITYQKKTC